MSTTFVQPVDLMKIRELRLRQELAASQAQSYGHAVQAELGRLYLKLGLHESDSVNVDTGAITIAAPPMVDPDQNVAVGPVPIDPGVAQTTGDPSSRREV